MNNKLIIMFLVLTGIATVVYGLPKEVHQFSSDECSACHFDEKETPMDIKPAITKACGTCHSDIEEVMSHPTDVYPTLSIPEDMPLIEGRLTCITCHYVHPEKNKQFVNKKNFLRGTVSGPIFCRVCHKIDEKGHIILENVHLGSYTVTDRTTRIDRMSLECITCHDTYFKEPTGSLGAGTWNHFQKSFNHPIGIVYREISARKTRQFRPSNMLPEGIKLFDGKIGCGTCHNIYSGERFMLVINNLRSRLCLECHIK